VWLKFKSYNNKTSRVKLLCYYGTGRRSYSHVFFQTFKMLLVYEKVVHHFDSSRPVLPLSPGPRWLPSCHFQNSIPIPVRSHSGSPAPGIFHSLLHGGSSRSNSDSDGGGEVSLQVAQTTPGKLHQPHKLKIDKSFVAGYRVFAQLGWPL